MCQIILISRANVPEDKNVLQFNALQCIFCLREDSSEIAMYCWLRVLSSFRPPFSILRNQKKSIACYYRSKNKKKNWNHFFPRAKTLRLNGFLFIWAYKISNLLVSLSQLKLTVANSNVCELIVATVLRYRCQHNKFDACKTVSSASVTNTIVNKWLSTG